MAFCYLVHVALGRTLSTNSLPLHEMMRLAHVIASRLHDM